MNCPRTRYVIISPLKKTHTETKFDWLQTTDNERHDIWFFPYSWGQNIDERVYTAKD